MKAVHFGAGNIGKGLIGVILSQSEFKITYIDADQKSVDLINKENGFPIQIIGENTINIDKVTALHVSEADAIQNVLIEADLITTSVGAANLVRVAPTLLLALLERSSQNLGSIDIIANENMINASTALKNEIYNLTTDTEKLILDKIVVFSNSAIDRLALSNEQGTVVEPYSEWVIQGTNIANTSVKNIKGVTYTDNMVLYIERKLFCVNANHAAAAYLAYQKGLTYIYEAFLDTDIVNTIKGMHKEVLAYFVDEYGFDTIEHEKFVEKTMKRHGNPLLKDDIIRVGASPLRKLGPKERLVAPFLKLSEKNLARENLAKVIAAALKFNPAEDLEAQQIQQNPIEDTLTNYCKIDKLDQELILKYLSKMPL